MPRITYNSKLIKETGKFLSKTQGRTSPRRIKPQNNSDSIQSSKPLSSRSIPRRATSSEFRNLMLATTLVTLITSDLAEGRENPINEKKSDDFTPDKSKFYTNLSTSSGPIFKDNPKLIFKNSINKYKEAFLANPSKALDLKSFSPELLLGFLQEKGFGHSNSTVITYLANYKDKQENFINFLKHSILNRDVFNLITNQVDVSGSNILHIACDAGNEEHVKAIFDIFDSAYFTFSNNLYKFDAYKLKKDLIMKFNRENHTPLMQAIKNNNYSIIKLILLESKNEDKIDYSFEVLMQENRSGDNALSIALRNKNYRSISSLLVNFDSYSEEKQKQIREFFIKNVRSISDHFTFFISNNNDDSITELTKILKKIKFGNENLKDLLTKSFNKSQDAPIHYLQYYQKIESITSLIEFFDPEDIEDRQRIKEIFSQKNIQNDFALSFLFKMNSDENIVKIIEVLKRMGYENLKYLLTQPFIETGDTAFSLLAIDGKNQSMLLLISVFDIGDETDRNLIKEIFLKKNKEGLSALSFLSHNSNNSINFEIIKILLKVFNNEELKNILNETSSDKRYLSFITNLILGGNDKAIEEILDNGLKIKIDELPYSYFSNIPNVVIYYLEAFKQDKSSQIKEIKYYNPSIDDEIEKKKIDFMDIKLNDDRDNPLMVEIVANDNSSKKVIITETNLKEKINELDLNLQNTFKLAESNKINQIVINLTIRNYTPKFAHEITIKLTRHNDGWDAVYHDPNSISPYNYFRPEEDKQTNEEAIKAICKQNGIKIKSIKEHENIIVNDRLGSCDTISSIVSASMVIGDDHSQKLAKKCRDYFSYDKNDKSKILSTDGCISHIGGDELNKKVKIILEEKLKLIESKIKEKPSSTIANKGSSENKSSLLELQKSI